MTRRGYPADRKTGLHADQCRVCLAQCFAGKGLGPVCVHPNGCLL